MSVYCQRKTTPEEDAEIAALNKAVEDAIAARTAWLDKKMEEISHIKVGDPIYDVETGECLGKVSRLYRFHQHANQRLYDTSLNIDYEYQTSPNCYDNTSRQGGRWFGRREDSVRYLDHKIKALRSIFPSATPPAPPE